ncbi:furin repeat-containing protein, putative [Entamoeba invadens IP1]|uniref:Furin repeat-containing protein, putative n=1 Tax=Entamoeba invadens IP1 TaxID=370355 RepID=A0A0A1UCS2_ENTIV|nr:furin repeat-containing protein, putative [Entamoeba invadens IP1]ELP93710.1 furin repeat-containing protein, putative [Entamoeba invadens IP1]|eukprot:XP_004260481.1 furin repeat-containing protein, putative [Entamoeba invadens IP1]
MELTLTVFLIIVFTKGTPFLKIDGKEPREVYQYCKNFERKINEDNKPDSIVKCTECESEYYKLDNGVCLYYTNNCNTTDTYLYLNNEKCNFCDFSCNTCDENGQCTCFFDTDLNECKKCVSSFETNINTEKVTLCKYCGLGQYTNQNLKTCEVATLSEDNKDSTNCALSGIENGKQVCLKCVGEYSYDVTSKHCTLKVVPMEGCSRQNGEKCLECDFGYYLDLTKCVKKDVHCESFQLKNGIVVCTLCQEGYYLNTDKECTPCNITSSPQYTYTSPCEVMDFIKCNQCNRRCISNYGVCVWSNCKEFQSNGKCGICDDGFYLSNEKCVRITYGGFVIPKNYTKCVAGYYVDYDEQRDTYSCKKCKGHFMECLTENTPVPGSSLFENMRATKSLPCDNENCMKCADDGKLCYKCNTNTSDLINGKCIIRPIVLELEKIENAPIEIGNYDTSYLFCHYKGVNTVFEEIVPTFNQSKVEDIRCTEILRRNFKYRTQTSLSSESDTIECVGLNRDPENNCLCKSGFYQETSSRVSDCVIIPEELNCVQSGNGKQCTVCPLDGEYTFDQKCICPRGTYLEETRLKCEICPKNCSACSIQNVERRNDIVCSECMPEDMNGEGRDPSKKCDCKYGYVSEFGKVDICMKLIDGCKNEGNYRVLYRQIKCLKCDKENFILGYGDEQCSQCIDGYYYDEVSTDCKVCDFGNGCSRCNSTHCLGCKDWGLIVEPPVGAPPNAFCTSCLDGFAYNASSFSCLYCPSVCDGCSIENTIDVVCKKCKNDNYPPLCSCGKGNYFDKNINNCKKCSNDLNLCTEECDYQNGYYVQCLTCKDENRNPVSNCTTCLQSNMFVNDINKCEECVKHCDTCTSKNYCTSCEKGTNRFGFQCEKCLSGYFLDVATDECFACNEKCANCTSLTECEWCKNENRKPVSGKACEGCNNGYYYNELVKDCVRCEKQCDVCYNADICLKCFTTDNYKEEPENGDCVCTDGFYYDDTIQQCSSCKNKYDEFCSVCNNNQCIQCNAEYLIVKNNKCECNDGFYKTSWGSCINCDRHNPGCLLCTDKEVCTKCTADLKLNPKTGQCGGSQRYMVFLFGLLMLMMI